MFFTVISREIYGEHSCLAVECLAAFQSTYGWLNGKGRPPDEDNLEHSFWQGKQKDHSKGQRYNNMLWWTLIRALAGYIPPIAVTSRKDAARAAVQAAMANAAGLCGAELRWCWIDPDHLRLMPAAC